MQLILGKIRKFDAIGCQVLRLKCTKFDFRWGSAPDPAEAAYSAPPIHAHDVSVDAMGDFRDDSTRAAMRSLAAFTLAT